MANFARKPESGGRPASSNAQPMKLTPRTATVPGMRNADLVLGSKARPPPRRAEGFARYGQHVGTRLAAALHQFDQEEESADRQDRTGEIEQRPPRHRDLARADRRQQRAGGDEQAAPARRGRFCVASTAMEPKAIVSRPPASNAVPPNPAEAPASPPNSSSRRAARIDAHLAEDGEDCCRRGTRRRIGAGQPEAERPHRRFGEEGDAEHRGRLPAEPVFGCHGRNAGGEVGHVERAGRCRRSG